MYFVMNSSSGELVICEVSECDVYVDKMFYSDVVVYFLVHHLKEH